MIIEGDHFVGEGWLHVSRTHVKAGTTSLTCNGSPCTVSREVGTGDPLEAGGQLTWCVQQKTGVLRPPTSTHVPWCTLTCTHTYSHTHLRKQEGTQQTCDSLILPFISLLASFQALGTMGLRP